MSDIAGPTLRIFRVVVRGFFADLDDEQRDVLLAAAPDHDIMVSAYTAAGTFTYDERLVAFSYRYEMRVKSDDDDVVDSEGPEEFAVEEGIRRATADLDERGIAFKRLRATATDMADMWR